MAKLNIYDMDQLKNVNEKRVWSILSGRLDEIGNAVCQCNICVVDMAAIALNSIKPCYQFCENLQAAEKIVPDEEILNRVNDAIQKVSATPHH